MAGVRFTALQSRPLECLECTRVTRAEFQQRVPPCEAALQGRLAARRREGTPRTARRCPVSTPCPLPTPAARLGCRLTSLQTEALQGGHGRLCGMVPGQAPQWMHVLWPALLAARRALGAAPPRALTALAQRRGVAAPDAAALVTPQAAAETPVAATPAGVPGSPLGPMRAPSGASSAPRTLRHSKQGIAASTGTPR
jgi:hypothetical protein